jgi:hypothetical protein
MATTSNLFRAAGGKFGILLFALIALLATSPLIVEAPAGNIALGLFADAALLAALHAARPGRGTVALGLLLAVADFAIGRLAIADGTRWLLVLQIVAWLSICVFVTATLLSAIFHEKDIGVETLQASLCVYLLVGLTWVFIYALIEIGAPGSFQSPNGRSIVLTDERSRRAEFLRLLVFSYSALTATGFGELAPASGLASIFANLEALSAQVYLAVVIARLVGIHASQALAEQSNRSSE